MSDIALKIAQLETLLAELKSLVAPSKGKKTKSATASDVEKPKRPPTDWIVFCGRVKDVLKANDKPITSGVRESTKFCSMLKTQKAYADWTDEAILAARAAWVMPVTPPVATPAASDAETVVKHETKPEVPVNAPVEAKEKKVVKPRAKKTA